MKKLKLNLEDLEIESFETMAPEDQVVGTVRGLTIEDSGCDTCYYTCYAWLYPECGDETYWSACNCFTAGAHCTET